MAPFGKTLFERREASPVDASRFFNIDNAPPGHLTELMKTIVVIVAFFVLLVLHQDSWNWNDRSLWLGFLPAGLGYHAAYSIVVALFWYWVSRFAWPTKVEQWAEEGDQTEGQ